MQICKLARLLLPQEPGRGRRQASAADGPRIAPAHCAGYAGSWGGGDDICAAEHWLIPLPRPLLRLCVDQAVARLPGGAADQYCQRQPRRTAPRQSPEIGRGMSASYRKPALPAKLTVGLATCWRQSIRTLDCWWTFRTGPARLQSGSIRYRVKNMLAFERARSRRPKP
jgi:hypothetical protein